MNTSEVNIPLLRKAVEWAEAEAAKPAVECRWYQANYVLPAASRARRLRSEGLVVGDAECGTCFCIAGYVSVLVDPRYESDWIQDGVDAHDRAQAALGLNGGQADDLFDGFNSIEDVRRIAEGIAGERL